MLNLENHTIFDLQQAMQENRLTSRQLTLHYLSRIAQYDKCEGGLNSVLEINPDALAIADTLDEMRANGNVLSPLHGIPVMIKDNISTADRMRTSAGSLALLDNYAVEDAPIVKKLRKAGALILGKTNLTEFSNYMTNDMPNGYSSRGGQTYNPYDRAKDPSGSSTGSAVSVSANLCTIAIGTETCGSIVSPAQENGIVGIKPTAGLWSNHGIIPISFTFDTAGPMAKTVTDAAILLGILANEDKYVDYAKCLDKDALKGARIGIRRASAEWHNEERRAAFNALEDKIIEVLKGNGATCIDLTEYLPQIHTERSIIMNGELKCGINSYLTRFGNKNAPKNLKEIINFNQINANEALKYGQSHLLNCQNNTSGNLTEPAYINAIIKREEIIREFDEVFDKNNVDVIFDFAGTGISAFTGFPSMSIPIGMKKDGVPAGSIWMARRFDEIDLLRVTYAVEQLLNARKDPLEANTNG